MQLIKAKVVVFALFFNFRLDKNKLFIFLFKQKQIFVTTSETLLAYARSRPLQISLKSTTQTSRELPCTLYPKISRTLYTIIHSFLTDDNELYQKLRVANAFLFLSISKIYM